MENYKYAILHFDPTDTEDQYAIFYNEYFDGGGDCHSEWYDTEDQRARRIEKDIKNGIIFLHKWGKL
jgi:hypothetical protein